MNVPYRQKFFSFKKDLPLGIIGDTIQFIGKTYLKEAQYHININSTNESIADVPIEELYSYWNLHQHSISILSVTINDKKNTVGIVFQFENEQIGANGNYNLRLNTVEDNEDVESMLWQDLELEKYRFPNQVVQGSSQMIVTPIFVKREFASKEKTCFVLMPFTEKWSGRVWDKFKEVAANENYIISRADNLYGHNILEDIWTAINEATIIFADITGRNPNVFYEIGIAHTLGKRVILLTQDVTEIPFDFKIYRHIIYEDNVDGFKILEEELPKYL